MDKRAELDLRSTNARMTFISKTITMTWEFLKAFVPQNSKAFKCATMFVVRTTVVFLNHMLPYETNELVPWSLDNPVKFNHLMVFYMSTLKKGAKIQEFSSNKSGFLSCDSVLVFILS